MTESVGFVGLGAMGGAIAARMLERGIGVLGFDIDAGAVDRLRSRGGAAAGSAREIADRCEIVFACLPTPEVCQAVALAPDGVAGGSRIRIYAETSTIGGEVVRQMAAGLDSAGVTLLDSPIVGGGVALAAGTAGVLVSGARAAFEQAKPVFEAYAGRLFYLGEEPGAAQAAKVMNNVIAHTALLATCEAIAIGLKSGLDLETAVAVINQGSGANFFTERVFPPFILKGIYDGTGAMEIGVKDVKCFVEEARRLGVEPPIAAAISELYQKVLAAGPPSRDTLQMMHFFTDLAGLPRPAEAPSRAAE
jgi:3-hydroxyisobutyrate dehydrogenase-like beta-hydroxyacid dehydrogenase